MAELFYFDKGVFDQLPPVERTKFRALLKTNMIPNGRPFFWMTMACQNRYSTVFVNTYSVLNVLGKVRISGEILLG